MVYQVLYESGMNSRQTCHKQLPVTFKVLKIF